MNRLSKTTADFGDSSDVLLNDGSPRLAPAEFNLFRKLILERCGIKVSDNKQILLQNRIGRRLKELNCPSFKKYYDYATKDPNNNNELVQLWSAITTNVTHFFRERHHFDSLEKIILPQMVKDSPPRRVNVWSAGCSTGQEPYTLAVVLMEFLAGYPGWSVNVLASDIDVKVLDVARAGVYPIEMKKDIPSRYLLKYFETDGTFLRVKDRVRATVQFREQNLREARGRLHRNDLIFCRNVMMYFSREFRNDLCEHYYRSLDDNGYLFIGSSESMTGMKKMFKSEKIGATILYRKLGREEAEIER